MNLKGVPPGEDEALDLTKGDQFTDQYLKVNPLGVVPSLVLDSGAVLMQSMAIMEYLEETVPTPPLLPQHPVDRAHVRALAMIPIAEVHPLMVPRMRSYIEKDLNLGEAVRIE
jgi:maleylacetoacetate isomerase